MSYQHNFWPLRKFKLLDAGDEGLGLYLETQQTLERGAPMTFGCLLDAEKEGNFCKNWPVSWNKNILAAGNYFGTGHGKILLEIVSLLPKSLPKDNTMKIYRTLGLCLAALLVLAECAKTDAVPLSSDEMQILVDAAPACGATGAQRIAVQAAAIETVRKGFDRFVVKAINGVSLASGMWTSPTTTTAINNRTAVSSGGWATIVRRHQNTVRIRMIRHGDPAAERAIDARSHLGPEWREKVADGAAGFC